MKRDEIGIAMWVLSSVLYQTEPNERKRRVAPMGIHILEAITAFRHWRTPPRPVITGQCRSERILKAKALWGTE